MGWATEDLWLNFQQRQESFLFYKDFILAFGKTQFPPVLEPR
jgi:hypothetical protein